MWLIRNNLLVICSVLCLLLNYITFVITLKCSRMPTGPGAYKTPADGRYHIRIAGNPSSYTPAKNYTIKIEGIERENRLATRYTYIGFSLIVMKKDSDIEEFQQDYLDPTTGLFSLLHDESLAKIVCGNMVVQTTSAPKSEIGIIWTAPPPGTGCVIFRATVVEHRDIWYMDDGPLSREFCEEDPHTVDTESMLNERCCACSEARYELNFEGLWSRNTHPKDFPSNTLIAKFSDIIGASHNYNYRFWVYNDKASEAVQQVVQYGETQMLETELLQNRQEIRTIIKARGLAYPNLNNKTVAMFRVDPEKHLISLLSMIQPSPDWFVGVSGIELCLSDCTWMENRIINMYPWDAGTDSGPTYLSPDQPTNPPDNIRRIKSDSPNDPRSPFYDEYNEQMEPIARLHLIRQRIYERPCAEEDPWGNVGNTNNNNNYVPTFINRGYEEDNDEEAQCALTGWTEWTECSPKCGRGTQFKYREYINPDAKEYCQSVNNDVQLQQEKKCVSSFADCVGDIPTHRNGDDELDETEDEEECEYSPWTIGPCSVSCGKGFARKSRTVISGGYNCNEELEVIEPCMLRKKCTIPNFCNADPVSGNCPDAEPQMKWFYNRNTTSCSIFSWKCRGNHNKFATLSDCEDACINVKR